MAESDGGVVGECDGGMVGECDGGMVGEREREKVGEREGGGWRGQSSTLWQSARSMFIFSFRKNSGGTADFSPRSVLCSLSKPSHGFFFY